MKTGAFFIVLFLMLAGFTQCKPAVKPSSCYKPAEPGICNAAIPRFYYNQATGQCEQFTWGGCGDVAFDTMTSCEEACE